MLGSTLSILARRCLKSLEVKSEAEILFKLPRFRKRNTHTGQQTLEITKKKIGLFYKICTRLKLRWCSEMNIGETWSFSLPGTWSKVPSSKKNRRWYFRQRSWFALARSLFHKQRVDDQKSINKFGSSRNILSRRAQMSTEICIKLFTTKRI